VGTRQVANAVEFAALLDELGFISFDLADLSIAEQRETLADAEVLLGADGSNLLGLYFAPAGCTVMALMDEPKNDMLVGPTCAFLGMEYQFVLCARAESAALQIHRKDQDIVVDCAALKKRILSLD
jgi:capsular polysaccharide biosynthesis protein